MELENQTRFPAKLFRGVIRGARLFGSLACRITYDLAGGELVAAADQPWPVTPGPWDSPQGPMPGDDVFYRGGIDLFVFANACAPGGRAVPRVDVICEVGSFRQTLAVFGDRIWEKKNGKFVISAPKPFVTMPLTMANAFGGQDEWDELPVPFPANPDGKGYRMFEENVPGTSLPNVESIDRMIRNWTDTPEPAGCGSPPVPYAVRAARHIEFDLRTGEMKKIDPKFFNTCFPDMIVPDLPRPGDIVKISGVRPDGPLRFVLPPNPLLARVWLDDFCHEQAPWIDQIGIEVARERVFVTYRFPFRYEIVPLEKRRCELLPVPATGAN